MSFSSVDAADAGTVTFLKLQVIIRVKLLHPQKTKQYDCLRVFWVGFLRCNNMGTKTRQSIYLTKPSTNS